MSRVGVGVLSASLVVALACCLRPEPAAAGVIRVEGSCHLDDAIAAANTDLPAGGCLGASGADEIVLTGDVQLSETDHGWNGVPIVTSEITVDGRGFDLRRSQNDAPDYRFFQVDSTGELTIRNLHLKNGRASSTGGGAVLNHGDLKIHDSELSGNVGLNGGAIFNAGLLTVEDSYLWGNEATGSLGGGAIISGSSCSAGLCVTTIERSRFSDNDAHAGGAILNKPAGLAYIYDGEFDSNEAGNGGGISNEGALLVTRSLFRENSAINSGGGLQNHVDGATATITNSTFSGNTAWNGGGIFNSRTCAIRQSTFYGNTGTNNLTAHAAAIWGAESWSTTVEGTIVDGSTFQASAGGADCSPFIEDLDNNFGCGNPAVTNLTPYLVMNGGPTATHPLEAGSNAIDAGGACVGTSVDQRGVTRLDPCDSGAHDYGECEDYHYAPGPDYEHAIIDTTVERQTCEYLWASYLRVQGAGGDLTLRAGKRVTLFDLSVEAGGTLTVVVDPSLLP